MRNLLFSFLLFFPLVLNAQTKSTEYKNVDEMVVNFSNSIDNNGIREIARFIYENFITETDKLRAAFVWITENFEYDVENMFNIKSYNEPQEIVDEMLETNKGVCMHFAYLFIEIGNILGIKSYPISGYTKQDGIIANFSHLWCVSFMDSAWYLIDPTWGAGHVLDNKYYVKKMNDDYFKAVPEKLIQSHFPFDPLWQFLNYLVSEQEFYDENTKMNTEKPFFNFLDTLKVYENSTRLEQLISSNRRIVENGFKNILTQNQLENNEKEIEFYQNQIVIDYYNSAVNYYNDGINFLNRFINYRNNQFTPQKSEIEIRLMIEDAEISLTHSQEELQKKSTTDASTLSMIEHLQSLIQEAVKQVNEQKGFINKYFDTKPMLRKTLFTKYYWMGIPLN